MELLRSKGREDLRRAHRDRNHNHQVRKTDEQSFGITEFEPNRAMAVKTPPGESPQLEMRFILRSEGDSTHVRDLWKLDTGRSAILEKLAGGKVKSTVAENLSKLKQLLEQGNVILQDGRRVEVYSLERE